MKRIISILAVLVMLNTAAAADELSFGAKGGIYSANITTVPLGWDDTAFKNGWVGGAFANYAFTKNFSVQPELLYTMKGCEGEIMFLPYGALKFIGEYNYLDIPVLAKYSIPTESGFCTSFFVGPNVGILLNANMDVEGESFGEPVNGSFDMKDVMSSVDFAFVFGFGFEYGIGGGNLLIDGRFNLGFTKIITGGTSSGHINGIADSQVMEEEETKNIGFGLLLGYEF